MENSSQPLDDASDQIINNEEQPEETIEDFNKQLEDIINTYGSASNLMEEQISTLETDEEILDNETISNNEANDVESSGNSEKETTAEMLLTGLGNDGALLLQDLNQLSSSEEKLEMVLKKYAQLLQGQRGEQKLLKSLQEKQNKLFEQRDKLQFEHSRGILARSKLESLCVELHTLNKTLKRDMMEKCCEDERKRSEIATRFQNKLVDIQSQIEHHSNRNDKLCKENNDLAIKLTSIIEKYEKREQLSEAKLEEANLRLNEADEKHKREKEYLLKEAIEKTRKCFTMKEQELQMKKQLLTHAAEWKLQSKELKEQNTVMQAQLVLYSQKFEEFQSTLAKSNEVYAVFKQEMNKMSDKMKNLEKESNLWKIRFESCNKALTDMIEEKSEKGKELEMFVLKIAKLETLCRALQDERKVLYTKIKDVRMTTLESAKDTNKQEISEITENEPVNNPAMTADMENLWKEQVRLQEFAASLLASISDDESEKESSKPTLPIKSTADNSGIITEEQCVEKNTKELVTKEASELIATIPEPVQTDNSQSNFNTESTQQTTQVNTESETTEVQTHEDYVLKPVIQDQPKKEVKFIVEVETETVEPEDHKESIQKSLVIAEGPKNEYTKENSTATEPTITAEPAKVESSTIEPEKAEGATATMPKPKGAKPQSLKAQEAKSKSTKTQPKIQSSTKKKGVSKNAKKS